MKRIAILSAVAVALAAGRAVAEPDPTACRIKSLPALVCLHSGTAAFMSELSHHDHAAVSSPAFPQVLVKNRCVAIERRDYLGHAVTPIGRRFMVHTALGRVTVQRITIPGVGEEAVFVATSYLDGPCLPATETQAIEDFLRKR